jgi:hypothetical protein
LSCSSGGGGALAPGDVANGGDQCDCDHHSRHKGGEQGDRRWRGAVGAGGARWWEPHWRRGRGSRGRDSHRRPRAELWAWQGRRGRARGGRRLGLGSCRRRGLGRRGAVGAVAAAGGGRCPAQCVRRLQRPLLQPGRLVVAAHGVARHVQQREADHAGPLIWDLQQHQS